MNLKELDAYLQEEYYTCMQLANFAGVTTDRITELVE